MDSKTLKSQSAFILSTSVLLAGCNNTGTVQTLDSLDLRQSGWVRSEVFVEPRSEEEVRAAYERYVQQSAQGESGRLSAIQRLAELEINRLNELLKNDERNAELDDAHVRASLERTRDLLTASLKEFPDASNSDETRYQLARVLEQLGAVRESQEVLAELSRRHPNSRHYPEVQFRLAETFFARADYLAAEDAYSEVLLNDSQRSFHERALFKRGWARYKQALYMEAIDDFIAALRSHPNNDSRAILEDKASDLDEYYRGLGLAFVNLEDLSLLQTYFAHSADQETLYLVYRAISNIYLQQERYSDAAGILQRFARLNPNSVSRPLAELQIVNIWRDGGFRTLYMEAIEAFYEDYHPAHNYWQQRRGLEHELVSEALRHTARELARYYHAEFKRSKSGSDFAIAERWYQIHLEHYSRYAQQDRIYIGLAELLAADHKHDQALHYFELAAYDGDIILDKEAAYATIVLSSQILQDQPDNSHWLDKQVHYALLSGRLYPGEERYHKACLHAAELAYKAGYYDTALQLLAVIPEQAEHNLLQQSRALEGLAYRESGRIQQAEQVFRQLLDQDLSPKLRREHLDNLALLIYQQAEEEARAGNGTAALEHYSRLINAVPDSSLVPYALYEQVLLAMQLQQWQTAIQAAETFKIHHGAHELAADVSRQASAAYLQAGDTLKAAKSFEQLAQDDGSEEVKMAALWQAAELYEARNEPDAAIRSYRRYAHSYPRPYSQYVEAMHRLTELYKSTGEVDKRQFWYQQIVEADGKAARNEKSARSNYLTALAFLNLGTQQAEACRERRLSTPLADNLRIKKQLLQESTTLLGRASSYGFADIGAEATHRIAAIYQDFARSLLESERPSALQGEELVQYNILLEDQAFPFEEQAIQFYEMNLARVRDGVGGKWIIESHKELAELFPARYARNGKVSIYGHD